MMAGNICNWLMSGSLRSECLGATSQTPPGTSDNA